MPYVSVMRAWVCFASLAMTGGLIPCYCELIPCWREFNSLFRCAGNSSRPVSQRTEFAVVFWTDFRNERRILKRFPVDSLLGGICRHERKFFETPASRR